MSYKKLNEKNIHRHIGIYTDFFLEDYRFQQIVRLISVGLITKAIKVWIDHTSDFFDRIWFKNILFFFLLFSYNLKGHYLKKNTLLVIM